MADIPEKIDSKFRFILLAAQRARQIQAGARPLVHTTAKKPTRVAQEELRAGVVGFEYLPAIAIENPENSAAKADGEREKPSREKGARP